MADYDIITFRLASGRSHYSLKCRTCGFMADGRNLDALYAAHDEQHAYLAAKSRRERFGEIGPELLTALIMTSTMLPLAGDGEAVERVRKIAEDTIRKAEALIPDWRRS